MAMAAECGGTGASRENETGGWGGHGTLESPAGEPYFAQHGAACPEGHLLQVRLHRDSEYEYNCDACGRDVELGAALWGCRDCDWDICADCHLRLEGNQAFAEIDAMELHVNTLDGSSCAVAASSSWFVCEVKVLLATKLGIPAQQQRLISGTMELQDDQLLSTVPSRNGLCLTLLRRSEFEVDWLQYVQADGLLLQAAPPPILENRDIVLAAVRQNGLAIRFAAEVLRADRQVVLVAVRQHGSALEHAADEVRADREVVLSAVQRRGAALKYASADLQADRDVVLSAVHQDGGALEHARQGLQADHEIVLAAVRSQPDALRHAAHAARGDRAIVLEAIRRDSRALNFASAELREKFHRFLPSGLRGR